MVTKEQILKWNAQLGNGWQFDLRYFIFHKEKTVKLIEKTSEKTFTVYKMSFWENVKNPWDKVEFYDVKINKSDWTCTEDDMATSSGLGITKKIIDKASKKKNFKLLADLTKEYTLEKVKSLYTGNEINPMA